MQPAEYNKETGLHRRMVSDCGKYEMGIYPVMYGFRIRAGMVGDYFCLVDYCAGNDGTMVNLLYNIMFNMIKGRAAEGEYPFRNLPYQSVKPMLSDPECLQGLVALTDEYPVDTIIKITSEELYSYRMKTFSEVWAN